MFRHAALVVEGAPQSRKLAPPLFFSPRWSGQTSPACLQHGHPARGPCRCCPRVLARTRCPIFRGNVNLLEGGLDPNPTFSHPQFRPPRTTPSQGRRPGAERCFAGIAACFRACLGTALRVLCALGGPAFSCDAMPVNFFGMRSNARCLAPLGPPCAPNRLPCSPAARCCMRWPFPPNVHCGVAPLELLGCTQTKSRCCPACLAGCRNHTRALPRDGRRATLLCGSRSPDFQFFPSWANDASLFCCEFLFAQMSANETCTRCKKVR